MKKYLLANLFIFSVLCSFSQTLNNIESVEYDSSENRFFISNGNSIIARASDGTLSFFSNQSATHGMEVMGDHLFVIDGSTIRGFELDTENEVMTLNVSGAGFLNGMTNDGNGNLFATDFSNKRIYKFNVSDLSNPTQEIIVNNTATTPNGIVYDEDNNRLIFVNWEFNATIKAVDLSDNSVSTIINSGVGSIDGIDEDNDKNYYISSWNPARITKFDSTFANPEIITTPFLTSPADICYAKEIDTLAIPHYPNGGNEVVFIGFTPDTTMSTSTLNLDFEDIELKVYPNPISENSIIEFELNESVELNLSIWSQDGKKVKTLLAGKQLKGKHKISFQGEQIPSGLYWLVVENNRMRKQIAILKL